MGKYSVVMGWHGREYLYRHLVDEFWEIPEEYMWLREYCRAFHHVSRNLARTEKDARKFGHVIDVAHIGNVAVFPSLKECPHCQKPVTVIDQRQVCSGCKTPFPMPGVFHSMDKSLACWLPQPSKEKVEYVKKYLPINAVGITARNRKTYGRNLDSLFYERLIFLLEDMGYRPVGLGEKVASLPCPFARLTDFSITEDAHDLEMTLALVSQMKFTVQFWTASSRLAALVGTPYVLFESPDQVWGGGQEGLRMDLLTRGERKLVAAHYQSVYEDMTGGLRLVYEAVREMECGNYNDMVGLVENENEVRKMKVRYGARCTRISEKSSGEDRLS